MTDQDRGVGRRPASAAHIYPDKYGVHRCATFGDFRERFKDLAVLLGYGVIEEDRA